MEKVVKAVTKTDAAKKIRIKQLEEQPRVYSYQEAELIINVIDEAENMYELGGQNGAFPPDDN